MPFYKYKGKRIRASDKSLVYRFCIGSLLLLFVAVILLLNMGQLMRTNWDRFTLISNDGLALSLSPYNFITIIMATGICILVAFLYYRFCYDRYKQLIHRQKLARMVLENGLLHIQCEITLGKYRDQLLQLEDKLESGLYCELTDKLLYDGYVEYTLL